MNTPEHKISLELSTTHASEIISDSATPRAEAVTAAVAERTRMLRSLAESISHEWYAAIAAKLAREETQLDALTKITQPAATRASGKEVLDIRFFTKKLLRLQPF